MKTLRWLLFPFSLLYGLIVIIRNWCYDGGVLKSHSFIVPIISVGNLDVGGAGKSPMSEYLVRLLKDHYKLATLSRGYGRLTKGYLLAGAAASASEVGDEPAQFKNKFPDITVAVCEKRAIGIQRLLPEHNLVILDDAYQHRAVKPGLSILLFDYNRLDEPRALLPAGNLREPFSGRWRADIIVISKCPERLTIAERVHIEERINAMPYQTMFFTSVAYLPMRDRNGNPAGTILDAGTTVFLVTGISNAKPLVAHIRKFTSDIVHHNYPDHHRFSLKNISKLAGEFAACASQKKVIITTEKDAQRLFEHELLPLTETLPVLVMPIGIQFLGNGDKQFDKLIAQYVREYTANHLLH